MSYRTLKDYNEFNNINEYITSPQSVNLQNDSTTIPKEFRQGKWADTKAEKKAKDELKAKREASKQIAEEEQENQDKEQTPSKNILIHYDEIKDYLDDKYREVVITNAYEAQIDIDDYIILNKYEFLKIIEDKIKIEEDKEYKDDDGNIISKEDYLQLLIKKFKDSYVIDDYFNGFKMEWTNSLLETHKPNINEYDKEKLKKGKSVDTSSEHQGNMAREIFLDSREDATKYETLEFNVKDYTINGFSESNIANNTGRGVFGAGASEVRKKIVDYAKNVYDLCQQGKAAYSQEQRYSHDDKAINGMNYYDCSSLVEAAYQSAGVTGITGTTYTEYPPCTDSQGGILVPIPNIDEAIAGDIIFFTHDSIPTTKEELQNVNVNNIYHVGIYAGNGQYIHASGSSSNPNIKISNVSDNSHSLAFGRPQDLVTLDSQSNSGNGKYSEAYVKVLEDLEGYVESWDNSSSYGAIGYGTDASGEVGKRLKEQGITSCTPEQAEGWLKEELDNWCEVIDGKLNGQTLSQTSYECMLDVCYQWGNQQWALLDLLLANDINSAKSMIMGFGYPRRDRTRCNILDGNYVVSE